MNSAEPFTIQEAAVAVATPADTQIAIHDGPVHAISAEHHAALAPATHFLHEWRDYRVTCTGAAWLEVGSEHITSFGPDSGQFQVRFENQIGLSVIRAFDGGGRHIETRHVEVISPKLGHVGESLSFL